MKIVIILIIVILAFLMPILWGIICAFVGGWVIADKLMKFLDWNFNIKQ